MTPTSLLAAVRGQAMSLHPDKVPLAERPAAVLRFHAVVQAFETLTLGDKDYKFRQEADFAQFLRGARALARLPRPIRDAALAVYTRVRSAIHTQEYTIVPWQSISQYTWRGSRVAAGALRGIAACRRVL